MDKLVNDLRKCQGYLSIEVVIIAGLMIGVGSTIMINFSNSGYGVSTKAIDLMSNAMINKFI